MPLPDTLQLGPFTVGQDGRLSPRSPDVAPSFTFRWRGRPMRARLRAGPKLAIHATLGRVPSTTESARLADPAMRERCFDALRALPKTLPEGWRMMLRADHRVQVETETTLDRPMTAVFLLTEVSQFLLEMAPYLDALDEAGLISSA